MSFQVAIKIVGGIWEVIVSGRLDSASASTFEQSLLHLSVSAADGGNAHNPYAYDGGVPRTQKILLDLTAVNYVASAGLRVVLLLAKRTKQSQGALVLYGLQPSVRDVFAISGFLKILEVAESRDDAIAKLIH